MTTIIFFIIITLLGLVVGSFLSAVTYRLPRGINIIKGRSFCDNCKRKISWRDNVPVFSFYFLGGKCRNCKSQISIRYPLIEFFTMLVFLFVAISFNSCTLQGGSLQGEAICQWQASLGFWALPYLLLVAAGFVVVFVTDFELEVIPDSIVFFLFALSLLILIFINPDYSYVNILLSFAGAAFLLLLHLITRGKGMGLGDVKLALLGGLVLGWPSTLIWMMLSFIIGAIVGLILILLKKAEFGKHIAFGPFLVASFFIALLFGNRIFLGLIH